MTVFLMPGGDEEGMLEDLCLKAWESDDAMPCVRSYFECLDNEGIQPGELNKAHIHALLASKKRPDLRLGEAAEKGYVPFCHPAFDELKTFLRVVAGEDA